MIGFIARVTGDRAGAEDLAQDTFVKAFRNLAAFDTSRRFSSWLLRIAHNVAVDTLRRQRLPTMPLTEDRPGSVPPDPVEQEALGRALDTALARLRPEYRAAIALRYQEGLPFDEIAAIMGIPAATARTYVHRARKELSSLLTASGWRPGSLKQE